AGDSQGPIADGKRHALGGAIANVAGGENAGAGGLHGAGLAVCKRPAAGPRGIGPRENKTLRVGSDAGGQPLGVGLSADEDEHAGASEPVGSSAVEVAQAQACHRTASLNGLNLHMVPDLDLAVPLDPPRQVV